MVNLSSAILFWKGCNFRVMVSIKGIFDYEKWFFMKINIRDCQGHPRDYSCYYPSLSFFLSSGTMDAPAFPFSGVSTEFGHDGCSSVAFLVVHTRVRACKTLITPKKQPGNSPPWLFQVLLLSLFSSAHSRIWVTGSTIRPALRLLSPASPVENGNLEKSYRGPKQASGAIQYHILHKRGPGRDK